MINTLNKLGIGWEYQQSMKKKSSENATATTKKCINKIKN